MASSISVAPRRLFLRFSHSKAPLIYADPKSHGSEGGKKAVLKWRFLPCIAVF